ncbi:hypothetical protein E8E11_004830 [Didymella keratinophila]|nr:hypothetical protein E8E11_004830 [Didymella keratinophila]
MALDLPISQTDFDDISVDSDNIKKDLFVEWDHDLDPHNPLNWPTWKKALNVSCIFLIPFTSSIFAPAIPDLMQESKSTDPYLSSFVLSIHVLGYAICPLLISPLSELYGRVPLYHLCNTLFGVSTLLCGTTHSLRTLAVARLFAGMGGSSVFALAPSSIADMFQPEKRGVIIALIAIGHNRGPSVSPTAGSYINADWGWRWILHITGSIGVIVTIVNLAGLTETYEPALLRRKAARLHGRKRVKGSSVRSRLDFHSNAPKKKALGKAMLMPLRMLLSSRAILLTSGLTAIGCSWMCIFYTTAPRTFLITYAWQAENIGLAYFGTALGALIGMVAAAKTSNAIVNKRKAKGDSRPENRLLPTCFLWPLVNGGLFLYAWTAQNKVHVVAPMLGTCIFGAGAMSAIVNIYTMAAATLLIALCVWDRGKHIDEIDTRWSGTPVMN